LTYVDGWADETAVYIAFVPQFTLGCCVDRGRKQSQIFNLFKDINTPGSFDFLDRLLTLSAMKPFRDSGASTILLDEFIKYSTLDHLGSVVQFHVDFTVGVINNYTMIEKRYGCLMPKSETSVSVHGPVSTIDKLNPAGLNTTAIQEEDAAIFCGHLGISINCLEFTYESCLSNILLPMQTDGRLPFRNTRRYVPTCAGFGTSD
jgi:hypothetical protein